MIHEEPQYADPEELARKRRGQNGGATGATQSAPPREFPKLAPEAFHGLAGEIVKRVEPHSESDPALLLLGCHTYFGNAVGRGPYHVVEGTRHNPNLFTLFVGSTSKSRKGTGDSRVRQIFEPADPLWYRYRIKSGLSSGEGLIEEVRDARTKIDKNGDEVLVDEGVTDKRLLVMQPEFGGALQALRREGSLLSSVLRDAWDGRDLATLVKHSPSRATAPHISIVGHITASELRYLMDQVSMANGLANRFLFACVERSKLLPFGGKLSADAVADLGARVGEALCGARGIEEVRWSADGAEGWGEIYGELSASKPGLLGALSARAEAHVIRLAMHYALWDGSKLITLVHLMAAQAVWDYCEASIRYIFDDRVGNPTADTILTALKRAYPQGLTRVDLSALFSGHAGAGRITLALQELETLGLATMSRQGLNGGRPAEVWTYVQP
jgi:Protein of unknown function (DUF3987)